ncbi:hypothetical protein AnigIFM63326_010316 [Aspergillus niger]|nr:hypothetical protein AnigIFM63326_010316 [Aspergillus niger]
MSLIPHLDKSGLSTVGRLVHDYDRMLTSFGSPHNRPYLPPFDICETDAAYYLEGELPGIDSNDLDIAFEGEHCLKIHGHHDRDTTTEKKSWWVSERSVGDFQRSFYFPASVDQANTEAHLQKGILSMTVPKSAEAHHKMKVSVV